MNSGAACRRAPAPSRPRPTGPTWPWLPRKGCWSICIWGKRPRLPDVGSQRRRLPDTGGAPGPPPRRRGGPLVDHGRDPERLPRGAGERHRRHPRPSLSEAGVEPVVMNGFIEMALGAIYGGGDLSALKGRKFRRGRRLLQSEEGRGLRLTVSWSARSDTVGLAFSHNCGILRSRRSLSLIAGESANDATPHLSPLPFQGRGVFCC